MKVPVLNAEQMTRDNMFEFDRDNNVKRACLVGWMSLTFATLDDMEARRTMTRAIRRLIGGGEIPPYNDTHSLAENAEVWNQAAREVGFHDWVPRQVEEPAEVKEKELVHA